MFPLIINTFKLFFGDTNDSPPQLDLGNRIVGWASESHLSPYRRIPALPLDPDSGGVSDPPDERREPKSMARTVNPLEGIFQDGQEVDREYPP